jgi:hypothetical protein
MVASTAKKRVVSPACASFKHELCQFDGVEAVPLDFDAMPRWDANSRRSLQGMRAQRWKPTQPLLIRPHNN